MEKSKKELANMAKQIANLPEDDRRAIGTSAPEDIPNLLRYLGVHLPASNWILVILKIILFALGVILAGMGTIQAATIIQLPIY